MYDKQYLEMLEMRLSRVEDMVNDLNKTVTKLIIKQMEDKK